MTTVMLCFFLFSLGGSFLIGYFVVKELDSRLDKNLSGGIAVALLLIGAILPFGISQDLGLDLDHDGEIFTVLVGVVNLGLWSLALLAIKLLFGNLNYTNSQYSKQNGSLSIPENIKLLISLIGFVSSILGIISFFLDHVISP